MKRPRIAAQGNGHCPRGAEVMAPAFAQRDLQLFCATRGRVALDDFDEVGRPPANRARRGHLQDDRMRLAEMHQHDREAKVGTAELAPVGRLGVPYEPEVNLPQEPDALEVLELRHVMTTDLVLAP